MKTHIYASLTALALFCTAHAYAQDDQRAIKPRAQATVINDASLSTDQTESDHDFTCGAENTGTSGYVIVGRKHVGDENKPTNYLCAKVKQFVILDPPTDEVSEYVEPEEGVRFICPDNKVLTGRQHVGDENDRELLRCATLKDDWDNDMQVIHNDNWSAPVSEHNHNYTCPANTVMVGKYHKGDEEGSTEYLCGQLW